MTIQPLIEMTQTLGLPTNDYVIIGEGNTSYRVDDDTFWIKASGQAMHGIGADGFVEVRFAPILNMVNHPPPGGDLSAEMKQALHDARVETESARRPSIEVTFHALLLAECNVRYIGHTHPTAVNRLLCSSRAEQFAKTRRFPDEIVLCGPESVLVPYTDPGLPLALAIRSGVIEYIEAQGEAPKVILLQNHGLIALGQTPTEVLNITAMCVKAAHIFAGACMVGEPTFLTEQDVMHIYRRPDEIYRRQRFVQRDG